MQRYLILVGCVLLGPGTALAAEAPPLAPESRVRVEVAGEARALTGRLVRLDGQSLTVSIEGGPQVIPRDQVRRVEVSRGRPSRFRRAAVGAAIGAASAVPAAAFSGEWHVTGPLALFGAVIGFSLPAHERWNAVEIRGVEVRCSPTANGGPGLGVSVSF